MSEMAELERIFRVRPAYDCIGVQPCVFGSEQCIRDGGWRGHGRHNAELHMTVRGPDAEITLVIGTGWDLPTVPVQHRLSRHIDHPHGGFVEFHTARPRYEGQGGSAPRADGSCKGWAGCYLDTGYSMSDEPTRLLVEKGSDAVWSWLEDLYATVQSEMAGVGLTIDGEVIEDTRALPGALLALDAAPGGDE